MECENCKVDHDGTFGSGRFCSMKCSRGFSTKAKRAEINEKVSSKLKGVPTGRNGWSRGESFKDPEIRRKAVMTRSKNRNAARDNMKFEDLPKKYRRPIILKEQNNFCLLCGMTNMWNGLHLSFHIDHIDGNHSNNKRDNLRAVCPNCHSQTNTYAGKNKRLKRELKESARILL